MHWCFYFYAFLRAFEKSLRSGGSIHCPLKARVFSLFLMRCYLFYSAAEIKMSAAGLTNETPISFHCAPFSEFSRTPLEFSSRCASLSRRARIRPRNYFPVIYCTCSARLFNGAARTPSAEENIFIFMVFGRVATHTHGPCLVMRVPLCALRVQESSHKGWTWKKKRFGKGFVLWMRRTKAVKRVLMIFLFFNISTI